MCVPITKERADELKFKIAKDSPVFNSDNESVISVQDLAAAAINELEKPEHIRERFTLGS